MATRLRLLVVLLAAGLGGVTGCSTAVSELNLGSTNLDGAYFEVDLLRLDGNAGPQMPARDVERFYR